MTIVCSMPEPAGLESITLLPVASGSFPPDVYYLGAYGALDYHQPYSPASSPQLPYNATSQSINFSKGHSKVR